MSYALCFAEQFYYPEDMEQVKTSERPTSVHQAVLSLSQEINGDCTRGFSHRSAVSRCRGGDGQDSSNRYMHYAQPTRRSLD